MENSIIKKATKGLNGESKRSAWKYGVLKYAEELLENLDEAIKDGWFNAEDLKSPKLIEKALLNGADSWSEYSWGGCSLIYNEDIAKRLCNPSELKKTKNGTNRPNASEEWLDVQARALYQASRKVLQMIEYARA